ncbi:pyridoxamine 5'-phosphate oxidase [Oleiharenicola lentus]|uniref:pyridoxamine 5'-phosphate oxidase n=1 Tax=Oleiharenicola lentus TaxID=2508720 RepID=UPI003F6769CA
MTRSMALADMRKDYAMAGLLEKDLAPNPFDQFEQWFREAESAKITEPNAMTLCTVGTDGRPSARTVLLKGSDARGFVFYTNYESRKARELTAAPRATLLFPWVAMERQIIIEGAVTRVSRGEADVYFHSRPRASQVGAWASPQSTPIVGREVLEESFRAVEKKYEGREIPLPPHWGGFRVTAECVEFWQGRRSRLHDRLRYRRNGEIWIIERLAP